MKGFSKLFLGLILMTLIGVGFKVDVKAADVPAGSVQVSGFTVPGSWDSSASKDMTVTLAFEDSVFGDLSADSTLDDEVKIYKGETSNLVDSVSVQFIYKTSGGKSYTYKIGTGSYSTPIAVTSSPISINIPLSKSNAYAKLDDQQSVVFTAQEMVSSGTKTATLSAAKVTLSAVDSDVNTVTGAVVTASPIIILPGDSKEIEALQYKGGLKFNESRGWTKSDSTVNNNRKFNYTPDSAGDISLVANYSKNDSALEITNLEGAYLKAGEKTATDKYKVILTGGGYADKEQIQSVTINGEVKPHYFSGDYIYFWAPEINKENVSLIVTMKDGQTYPFTVNVINADEAKIAFEKSAYPLGTNTETKLNLIATGPTPTTVTYKILSGTGVEIGTQSKNGVVVKTGTTAATVTIEATAKYDEYAAAGIIIPEKKATTTVTVQSLKMKDDLFVNKGQTVKLGDFISVGNKDMTVSTLVNNADSYIDLTGGAGSKLKDIAVKGKSKVAALDKTKFVVDGNQMKVTVYEAPSLSVETSSGSSSSGSYTYSYKVTMPKGVYYGDDTSVWVTDLKKAILIFKGSGDDAKTKEVVLDSDWKDDSDKLSMSVTKKLDVKTLTGYLRDIGKKDEETISVYACAVNGKGNNDDTIKTETKEMKAYKISLDTNGGKTSYTVNGDSVSDYFYKIDGVEYTVVARGTGTLDKKSSVNADNATTSSGMATIVLGSSGAGVAGERRIKAAFSSSSSGGTDGTDAAGGDGYDDVPKTGESKTDIWILWSVLFIAILGAGFMIWKRFGLVRAIAEAEHQEAVIQREEQVRAEKKAKEDKLNMLKDLRNL